MLLFGCAVLLGTSGQAPHPPGDSATAFVGANVLRSDRAGFDRNQVVIVRGDRIVWVGPRRAARLPPGTRRIDSRGQFLLPGFADMHVHLQREGDLVTYLANGITTVRNLWGSPQHLAWRDRIARGELLGPRMVTSGPIIDGTPPSVPSMLVLTDPARARAEVEKQHAAGYDFIKVYNSVPALVYDTIIAVARELGIPVAGHVPFEAGLAGVLRSRQASIEHLRGYVAELVPPDAAVQPGASLRSRSLAWNYVDPGRMPALVSATVAAGVWNVPTLMVTGELLAPPARWGELARRSALRYLGPGAVPDRSQVPYLADFTPADYEAALDGLGPQRDLVRALDQAGAGLLLGTDSYLQGFAFQAELEEFDRAGIDRWRILMAATRRAAEFLGEAGDWGEVAAGQRADLQLVRGDPLASFAALARRSGVMLNGRWLPRQELQTRLDSLARAYERAGSDDGNASASAAMNRRARSGAAPGERGPDFSVPARTSSVTNVGPGSRRSLGSAADQAGNSLNRNTDSQPHPAASAPKSTGLVRPPAPAAPGVGWPPVTSYTPLWKTTTTRFVGLADAIDTSEPRFISIEPSPFSTTIRRAGCDSASPSPIEVACPMAEGTNTRSSGWSGPRAIQSRAGPMVVITTSRSLRAARTAATASRLDIPGLMPSPPRPAPHRAVLLRGRLPGARS